MTDLPVAARQSGKVERLLLVDDEEPLVKLVSLSLVDLGYRVTGFTDPEKALAEFRSRPRDFDAVVSDLAMPRMSGLELARSLLEVRPDVPIVLTSGYVRSVDEAAAKEMGILGFAFKGNSTLEIARSLDRIFRREGGPEALLYAEPT